MPLRRPDAPWPCTEPILVLVLVAPARTRLGVVASRSSGRCGLATLTPSAAVVHGAFALVAAEEAVG
jgi:hypothetical protein